MWTFSTTVAKHHVLWWVGDYLPGNCLHSQQAPNWAVHLLMLRPTRALTGKCRLLISIAGILRWGLSQAKQGAASSHLTFINEALSTLFRR